MLFCAAVYDSFCSEETRSMGYVCVFHFILFAVGKLLHCVLSRLVMILELKALK